MLPIVKIFHDISLDVLFLYAINIFDHIRIILILNLAYFFMSNNILEPSNGVIIFVKNMICRTAEAIKTRASTSQEVH
jgi:hypothetical protein